MELLLLLIIKLKWKSNRSQISSKNWVGYILIKIPDKTQQAGLAQSVERQALNLMVVGSSPTVGVFCSDALLVLYKSE